MQIAVGGHSVLVNKLDWHIPTVHSINQVIREADTRHIIIAFILSNSEDCCVFMKRVGCKYFKYGKNEYTIQML